MTVRESPEALIQDWLSEGRDAVTGALLTVDTVHHEVHEGEYFTAEYTKTGVADAGTVQYVLTTGAKQPHFTFGVAAGGACLVSVYEGATSTGGTAIPIYNNDRLSANLPTASIVHTPTAGTAGTVAIINSRYVPGGAAIQARASAALRSNVEHMLRTSTKYMINVVNVSGGAITVNSVFEWYEEEV